MLEKALAGDNRYKGWIAFLLIIMGIGGACYIQQFNYGLGLTGMSRDVTWGVYIAQFTFLVGVAASGVMVVLPYYLHNFKTFGKITILGEFLAVAAVSMCLMFIIADLGQPLRAMNVLIHPTPNSILFWDMIVLNVYLFLNIFVGWIVLTSEKKEVPPPKWIKPFIYVSIPWAASIHTVTAFLYAGLPGRHFWLTAIMAPRFLASAFAGGPALLLVLCLIIKRVTKFDAGKEAIQKLVTIITYAAIINLFFVGMEFFTAYYSQIPGHMHTLDYLFFGLHGTGPLVPWMWMRLSLAGMIITIIMLLIPAIRQSEGWLALTCILLFFSLWIDKGIGLVIGGFVPNMLEEVTTYTPSFQEIMITMAVWATGFLILTLLYKIAIAVKEEKMIE
jgi:molybdopterin-containing oxidoreductase family membrane subunit